MPANSQTPPPPPPILGLLIAGLSCPSSAFFAPLLPHLSSISAGNANYTPLDLPSIDPARDKPLLLPHSAEIATDGLIADAATIRAALDELIVRQCDQAERQAGRQGRNGVETLIIPIAHSYGGAPTLLGCDGLWRSQRARKGLKGGVDAIGLIASALPLPGNSVASLRMKFLEETGGVPDPVPELEGSVAGPLIPPTGLGNFFFADMTPEECAKWSAKLRAQLISNVTTPLPFTNPFTDDLIDPREWKLHYLMTGDKDIAQTPAFQDFLIKRAEEMGVRVERAFVDSGHFPMVTDIEGVVEWLRRMIEIIGGSTSAA